MADPISIVVLISGNGSNLQSIIDHISLGQINGKIRAVISNVPDAFGLERAAKARIPTEVVDHTEFEERDEFDRDLARKIENFSPDLIVLAGFMRLLGERFVKHYDGRMLNIHPSLLPKYPGMRTHKKALKKADETHGATVHFVTPEMDAGPIVIQGVVNVLEGDTEDDLKKRVFKEEHVIYPLAIGWFAEGRLSMQDDVALWDGAPLQTPILRIEGSLKMPEKA